ncbi:NAD(P)/FAD-dependent oxidoreductase [Actibacterium lipolyticum]|uniref:Glutathione reductase n=1 Tax=Actibacterium lipolyticum TaxID=1524263 RepID=A0A238KGW6_9RHOB|nr:NAD(P)/FAD-dependent oxidoreductase [Actibacterium lipolyticum]SMX41824.1 glutathione reductase [Actibacterium lipolyticum]
MAQDRFETVILGAGAAGLMCAAYAGANGGRVLVIDHAKAAGEKIRISGGGRCNFTNMYAAPANFLSANPHFAKSALARYTQWDFVDLVARHGIAYHEKTLGQLFCDDTAKDIIRMLLDEMAKVGAELRLHTSVTEVAKADTGFTLTLSNGQTVKAQNVVVATGGKSIPKMGATGFGYQIAEQFDHAITETRPALVPLTFGDTFKPLAGVATPTRASCNGTAFDEALLFTHRGLSGPAILQISSFWREGDAILLNLFPDSDPYETLRQRRAEAGRKSIATVLAEMLPNRLASFTSDRLALTGNLADYSDAKLQDIARELTAWQLTPAGSEGYRTAEVTLGGVDTAGLNSKTMESKSVPGLYFIGEVVDVTGWLGGYNFQWAWSSGVAAGTAIASA